MKNPFIFIGYDNHTTFVLRPTDHTQNVELLRKHWRPYCLILSRGYYPDCDIYAATVEQAIRAYEDWAAVCQEQHRLLAATLGIGEVSDE